MAATYVKDYSRSVLLRIRCRYVSFVWASYRITAMTTLSEHLSRLGKKGGKSRAKNMTPEERSNSARKAVEARWAKQKAELKELVGDITERTKALEKRAKKASLKR